MSEIPQRLGADKAWTGAGSLPQAFTGEGVVAGVVDGGFDFTHPMFLTPDGETRISRYYDMTQDDEHHAKDSVYYPEDILPMQHSARATTETHGTYVASLMAGSRVQGERYSFAGMAPESDLVLAELNMQISINKKWQILGDLKNGSDGTTANCILAYKRIFDYADEQGKPCVVNFSGGFPFDITDPCILENEAIRQLLGPGHILVAGAGNSGHYNATFEKPLGVDSVAATFSVEEYGLQIATKPMECYLLTQRAQRVEFGILSRLVSFHTDDLDVLKGDTMKCTSYREDSDFIPTFYAFKVVDAPKELDGSLYKFCIDLNQDPDKFYWFALLSHPRVSIVGDSPCSMFTNPMFAAFQGGHCSAKHTIYWPASIDEVVSVGAIASRNEYEYYGGYVESYASYFELNKLAYFSSQGPSWNNCIKPEVVAPGVMVFGARNKFYGLSIKDYSYDAVADASGEEHLIDAEDGTSMASPIAAGAIALWLQAKPDMTPEEVKEVLAATCSHPADDEDYPNNRYGYGEIDVYAGLLHILGLTDKIDNLTKRQPLTAKIELRGRSLYVLDAASGKPLTGELSISVYSLDGKRLLSSKENAVDLTELPIGVYAIQLNTGQTQTTGSTLVRLP